MYQDVAQGQAPAGIEYYLPLFYTETETLLNYLPADLLLITEAIANPIQSYW